MKRFKEYLECVGATEIRSNLMGIKFTKVLMNSTFSGMSAALGCTFGDVLDESQGHDVLGVCGQ